jgi:hypothetical protein
MPHAESTHLLLHAWPLSNSSQCGAINTSHVYARVRRRRLLPRSTKELHRASFTRCAALETQAYAHDVVRQGEYVAIRQVEKPRPQIRLT